VNLRRARVNPACLIGGSLLIAFLSLQWSGVQASSITQPGLLLSRTVTLTQSNLLALDTPFTLIPTPGAGQVIFPFALRWRMQPVSHPYISTSGGPQIWWGSQSNPFGYWYTSAGWTALRFASASPSVATDTATFVSGIFPSVTLSVGNGADPSTYANVPIILQMPAGDSLNRGPVLTVTPNVCGSGYHVNDIFSTGGDATFTVSSISGGGCVTGITIMSAGTATAAGNGIATVLEGNISSSTLNMAGTGYAMGDTFTVNGGCDQATGVIDTIGAGGSVATYHLTFSGDGYSTTASNPTTATSGVGTGLTLNIVAGGGSGLTVNLTVQPGDGTLTVTIWYTVAPE
jgi:hypothetical protein